MTVAAPPTVEEAISMICSGESPAKIASIILESFTTAGGTMTIGGPEDTGKMHPRLAPEMAARRKRKTGDEFNGYPESVHLGGTRRPAH